ncbi:DedA family protein [Sulfurospirillum diekertiae]|uniref:DedA family protein n=1 Tax=Sulfurospirillum diekertiae TaxID=1854492 RepID=A0A290HCL5_9BACT|nr:DedA family protein [Sulfurospirillum diekertiae]ATB69292.1 membrane protein [Sulfurospirillum diekertiae]QIR76938.1 DedA family protein [Sulfurospirillum diekertiae]QIR79555.1 DedA family protein [Sulfurospirillum diekertiae]
MEDILSSLTTYGYIILFLYSFGGGMLAIIAAGVLSYAGKMDLTTSIVVAAFANVIGSSFLFYMGRYNKKALMPYIKDHRRKLALSHILMKKYGDKIIFIQKFIYGLKTLVPMTIGVTKYPQTKFHIINTISAILWAVILGIGSYKIGDILMRIATYFSENTLLAPLILLSIIGIIWFYFQYATKKKH